MPQNKQMGTKYDRRNYFTEINHKVTEGNDIQELDLSSSYFRYFKATRTVRPFQLTRYDEHRPDRVSQECYGVMDYWWIILKFNDISDVFYEFEADQIIQIPDKRDVTDFLKVVKKRKSKDEKNKDKEFKVKGDKAAQVNRQ